MKPSSVSVRTPSVFGKYLLKAVDLSRYFLFYRRAKSEYLELWYRRDKGVLLDIGLTEQDLEDRLAAPIWSRFWWQAWLRNRRPDI